MVFLLLKSLMSAAPNLLHQVVAALQGIGFRDPECLGSAELGDPVGSTRAFRKLNGFLMSSNRALRRDLLMPFEGVECGCWLDRGHWIRFRWVGSARLDRNLHWLDRDGIDRNLADYPDRPDHPDPH